jgi:hypothetical protein
VGRASYAAGRREENLDARVTKSYIDELGVPGGSPEIWTVRFSREIRKAA